MTVLLNLPGEANNRAVTEHVLTTPQWISVRFSGSLLFGLRAAACAEEFASGTTPCDSLFPVKTVRHSGYLEIFSALLQRNNLIIRGAFCSVEPQEQLVSICRKHHLDNRKRNGKAQMLKCCKITDFLRRITKHNFSSCTLKSHGANFNGCILPSTGCLGAKPTKEYKYR